MVNVRYRSAADLGPRLPETPPPPVGEAPPVAVAAPADPTEWSPALIIVAVLLGILAFLLGSAHIGNADVWLTLATGRLIHTGAYQFGVDPFSWASEGTYWANSSWLGSWLFYLATLTGKAGLGIARAVLVTALAGLVVATRSPKSSLLLTMTYTIMALLAASPRFLAQTTLFSYLGVAVLLWILVHDGHLDGRERPVRRLTWFLPLLFLVWSNLDGYYVLGLFMLIATAGCRFLVADGRAEAKRLALVSAASVLACVLNPHLLRNLELPGELSFVLHIGDSGRALALLQATEPTTFGMMSPMSTDYLSLPNFGWNLAGLAFDLLFLFNLGSFLAVAATSVRTPGLLPRIAIAGGLGLLALLQWTFIPFYALVAGPITVLNLTDRQRAGASPAPTSPVPPTRWSAARGKWGAVGAMVALLLLIFLAWPGWLHLGFGEMGTSRAFQASRRVNLELEPEPSLHQAALALEAQAQKGEAQRVFQPAPELPAYCAYFAPSIKCGIDRRYGLFRSIAADYAKVRDDLAVYVPGDPEVADKIREWKIDHVALTGYRLGNQRTLKVGDNLLADSKRWRLDYADGRTVMFRWSPDAAWTGEELLEDMNREAFAPTEAEQLPDDRAVEWPSEPGFWEQYLYGVGPLPLAVDAARWQQAYFKRVVDRTMEPPLANWQATMMPAWQASVMAPAAGVGPAASYIATALTGAGCTSWMRGGLRAVDLGPPALPILMQRNVRRALAENPRHPFVRKLQVDLLPITIEQEAHWVRNPNPTPRANARMIQRVAALEDAIVLMPDNPFLHRDLAQAYSSPDLHLLDAFVEQLDLYLRGVSAIAGGTDPEKLKKLMEERDRYRSDIERRRADYELKSAGAPPLVKARIAMFDPYRVIGNDNKESVDPLGRGLALEAIRVLQAADPATLRPGDRLARTLILVQLFQRLGRMNDATAELSKAGIDLQKMPPEIKMAMAESNELISISAGWYKNLDKSIELMEDVRAAEAVRVQGMSVRQVLSSLLNMSFADRDPPLIRVKRRLELDLAALEARNTWTRSQMFVGDIRTLRGIFLLEQGNVAEARLQFEQATPKDAPFVPFADRRIAERYRDLLQRYSKAGR